MKTNFSNQSQLFDAARGAANKRNARCEPDRTDRSHCSSESASAVKTDTTSGHARSATVLPTVEASPRVMLMRLRDVLRVVPVSRSSWYAGVKAGLYPPPVRIGIRSVAWRSDAVELLVSAGAVAPVGASDRYDAGSRPRTSPDAAGTGQVSRTLERDHFSSPLAVSSPRVTNFTQAALSASRREHQTADRTATQGLESEELQ